MATAEIVFWCGSTHQRIKRKVLIDDGLDAARRVNNVEFKTLPPTKRNQTRICSCTAFVVSLYRLVANLPAYRVFCLVNSMPKHTEKTPQTCLIFVERLSIYENR